MERTELLKGIAADLRSLADKTERLAGADPVTPEPIQTEIKLEEVRAALAEISRAEKREQVKSLLTRFGADRLSGVAPENYAALLAAAKELI